MMGEDDGWDAETWGGGGMDWGGMPSYGSAPDPMNLPPEDPASPWYRGPVGSGNGGGDPGAYMPGGTDYIPPGGGLWQRSWAEDWNAIYAPERTPTQAYPTGGGGYSGSTTFRDPTARPSYQADFNGPAYQEMGSWSRQPTGGGGPRGGAALPGAQSVARQTPQTIQMGQPQDDLYQRYKSLLMNPNFSGDPTYQFLYNQGLQALQRSQAAQRMSLSGKSMNDTMAYGSGMASKYMQDLLPQYRGGAQEELNRFMGPAGLLPRYAATNNATIGQSNQMVNFADDRALYRDMLSAPDGGGGVTDMSAGIGYGGMNSGYTAQPRVQPPSFAPRPLSSGGGQPSPYPYYDGYDLEGGPAYG